MLLSYLMVQDPDPRLRPAGDVFHPEFEVGRGEVVMRALAPCQSLGAFYVSPTPASQRFLEVLSHWIMHT